jgi:hypothetical protein
MAVRVSMAVRAALLGVDVQFIMSSFKKEAL